MVPTEAYKQLEAIAAFKVSQHHKSCSCTFSQDTIIINHNPSSTINLPEIYNTWNSLRLKWLQDLLQSLHHFCDTKLMFLDSYSKIFTSDYNVVSHDWNAKIH